MWSIKYFAMPVITGATEISTKDKMSGSNTWKEFNRYPAKNSRTRNTIHHEQSATV
jgi:hypothetical protein